MTFALSKMSGFSIEEKVHEFESKGFLEISNEIFYKRKRIIVY